MFSLGEDLQPPFNTGSQARCAIHPERGATGTCTRCGNFVCSECSPMCPTCRALLGGEVFPYTRAAFSFDELWNFVFEKWKQEWVMLSVCVLILTAIGMVSAVFNAIFQAMAQGIVGSRSSGGGAIAVSLITSMMSQFLGIVVQGVFQMGLYRVLFDVLNGRKADVARMMTQFSKLGRYLVQMLMIGVMVVVPMALYLLVLAVIAAAVSGISLSNLDHIARDFQPVVGVIFVLGSLLLIPVLFYVALPLTFATMELTYSDCQPLEAIRRSFQLASGFRFSIFGYAFIAGLVAIVGVIACCIGILPAIALGQMLMVALYLTLRNGSSLPAPAES